MNDMVRSAGLTIRVQLINGRRAEIELSEVRQLAAVLAVLG
jgi:hypothetical protein